MEACDSVGVVMQEKPVSMNLLLLVEGGWIEQVGGRKRCSIACSPWVQTAGEEIFKATKSRA